MKNFLSKYWKRILIFIGSILIIINVAGKCTAPRLLVEEYAKYGPTVEASGNNKFSGDASSIIADVAENSPFDEEIIKIIIILAVSLLAVSLISDMANKKSSGGKKK